jgi:Domain of unknown function (DUF4190)
MSQPQYAPTTAQAVRGTNVMAILSLIFAFVLAPLGIIFGYVAKRQIRRTGEGGNGLATAGLVFGWIFTVAGVLSAIFAAIWAGDSGTPGY